MYVYIYMYMYIYMYGYIHTGVLYVLWKIVGMHMYAWWRRRIECLEWQVNFRKRATNYRALLRNMIYKDEASYGSSPLCIQDGMVYVLCVCICICICYPYVSMYIRLFVQLCIKLLWIPQMYVGTYVDADKRVDTRADWNMHSYLHIHLNLTLV